MVAKALFVFCASALFIQSITAQYAGNAEVNNIAIANGLGNNLAANYGGLNAAGLGLSNLGGNGFFGNGFGNGYGIGNGVVPSNGGGFTVTSYSPIAPTGISVVSENAIDGSLAVSGALPFLSAIGLEGQVPAAGAAGVQYGCGNGNVGIVSENSAPAGYNGFGGPGFAGAGFAGPGLAGLGHGAPLANAGLAGSALNGPIGRGLNGGVY